MQYLPQIIKTLETLKQQFSIFQREQHLEMHRMGRERSHSESSINSLHTRASANSAANSTATNMTNMQYDSFIALLKAKQSGFIPGAGPSSMGTGSRRETNIEGRRTPLKSP